jgi:hypothetical protein
MTSIAARTSEEPSLLSDHRLEHIFHYWQAKRGKRAMPQRADIRPSELGAALRLINLVDVIHDPLRFRHRLVGSEHVEWLGRNATGRYLDETLYGEAAGEILAAFATIVREKRPYFRLSRLDWNNQKWLVMEAVELPLAGNDGEVNMILRGAVFRPARVAQRMEFSPLA